MDRGRDHVYFILLDDKGRKTIIYTKRSHSHNEIGDYLISEMAKDLRIKKKEFLELIDCTLSKDEYYKKVFNEI